MENWKEGDPLPPPSSRIILDTKNRKLSEAEKSRKFWLTVIGCLNIIMLLGMFFLLHLVTTILRALNWPEIVWWISMFLLGGVLIYVNNRCMEELDRKAPRTSYNEL